MTDKDRIDRLERQLGAVIAELEFMKYKASRKEKAVFRGTNIDMIWFDDEPWMNSYGAYRSEQESLN